MTAMDKIILGIVQALLCQQYAQDEQFYGVTHTAEVLYRKIMAMPLLLRTLMTAFIYVFNVFGVFVGGGLFENLNLQQRQAQLRQWQHSPIGPCREGMAFFNKMTFFLYFSLCPKND